MYVDILYVLNLKVLTTARSHFQMPSLPKPKQYVIMTDCDLHLHSSAAIALGVLMVAAHVPQPWLSA